MKIFRAFCSTNKKLLLLNDQAKLAKYLRLAYQTPISYQGLKASVGYSDMFRNAFAYHGFKTDAYPYLVKLVRRDLQKLEIPEYLSFLQSINNFLYKCKSEQPQNEPDLQEALKCIVDEGTFMHKIVAAQHLCVYFDSKVTLYSQQAMALKDSLRDAQCLNIEDFIYKKYWELLDVYDQEKINLMLQDPEGPSAVGIELTSEFLSTFLQHVEQFSLQADKYNLCTQMILYELTCRYLMDEERADALTELEQKRFYVILKTCQGNIDRNLKHLNNFYMQQYVALNELIPSDMSLLSWDLIKQELMTRDFKGYSALDLLRMLVTLGTSEREVSDIGEFYLQKLLDVAEDIRAEDMATVIQVIASCNTKDKEKYLKKLYPLIDIKALSPNDQGLILRAFNDTKLITHVILNKLLPGIEAKVEKVGEQGLIGPLDTLTRYKMESPIVFRRATKIPIELHTDPYFLLSLLGYCQRFHQKNDIVEQIQIVFAQQMSIHMEKDIMLTLMQVLMQMDPASGQYITLIPELQKLVVEFLEKYEQIFGPEYPKIRAFLSQIYHLK